MSVDRTLQVGGTVIGLIGGGLLLLFPNARWVGWSSVGLGVAVLVGATLWVVASRHGVSEYRLKHDVGTKAASPPVNQSLTQHAPITNTNNPVFAPVFAPNFNQSQSVPVQAQKPPSEPPQIEPGLAQIEKSKIDGHTFEVANLLRSATFDVNNSLIDADVAFAKFHRDDASLEPWVDVKAKIEFFNNKNESLFRVDRAHWWKKEGDHTDVVSFRAADTGKMIVALVGGDGRVLPYSGQYIKIDRFGFHDVSSFVLDMGDGRPLDNKEFIVRVELIGTRGGIRLLKKSFDYDLQVEPKPVFKLRKGDES
jgi:hypothetical protein